ncbi:MAG TPA: 2-C-methyl-D-erythritol 2,4-cyclodiphosphate synthase [Candidatus Binataceae bacterium]|jgi:2-C-methyl-D-erythritol 2,4-cyclodiphosphate synthase|nr:2-C-methyl-D-erythritol 2,4-cyclodiphosphate synthase [Candidatus Binataceae bacterium]
MKLRIGQGFDAHPLESGRRLVLGGVQVPHDRGLRGHSDADVAAHALANAILGALGEGDLGRHFPDQDAKYKDANSIELLRSVWRLATAQGFKLANADVTIIAQLPRLAPFLDQMRANLAAAIDAEPQSVNLKASNPEGLGALGRGEGITALAAVLLQAD